MNDRKSPGAGHVRERTLRDSSARFDVLVKEEGKQRTLIGGLKERDTADAYLAAYHVEREAAGKYTPIDTGIITLRKLGVLYLASLTKAKLVTDKSRWEARVESADFIDWPLTQISESAISEWIDTMASTPIEKGKNAGELPARQTLQNSLNLLRSALRWAKIKKHIDRNPAIDVEIRESTLVAVRSGKDAFDYLHIPEVRRILESDRLPEAQRVAFTLLAFTGARPKDLYLLTWDRVDVDGGTVMYTTHKKKRDYLAHLLPLALEAMRSWWLRHGRPGTGLVFPGPEGKPHAKGYDWGWSSTRGKRVWKKHLRSGELKTYRSDEIKTSDGWREKIGIRRPVALYSLRHTCASQLLLGAELYTGGRAWSLVEIASHLGHADTKTVERYAQTLGIASKRAVEESRAALKNVGRVERRKARE